MRPLARIASPAVLLPIVSFLNPAHLLAACVCSRPRRAGRTHLRRRGFTLVEVMVLLVVLGVIALIVIPRLLGAIRRSNEAALRSDLRNFRTAVERFQADCGGYPPRLDDVMVWRGADVSAGVDGAGHCLDVDSYRGPYLRTGDMLLPHDPITERRDWRYDSATGEVHSNSDSTASDGRPYSAW